MARRRKRDEEEVKMDMTPMIDVTFLLLIFFIVTLKFKTLEGRLEAALPKDRGVNTTETDPVEKVDIVILIRDPGQLVPDPAPYSRGRLKHYVNRRVTYEVGSQTFNDAAGLSKYLEQFARTQEMRDETPISIDPKPGSVYGDVVTVLDVVIAHKFTKIAFGGSFEE